MMADVEEHIRESRRSFFHGYRCVATKTITRPILFRVYDLWAGSPFPGLAPV